MFTQSKLYDTHRDAYNLIPQHCGKVLDLACQKGDTSNRFLDKTDFVCGVDIVQDFLFKGQQSHRSIRFVNARVENLPFKEKTFGCCVLTEMLGCISDQQACVNEAYRVLAKSGKILISVPQKGLFCFLDPDNFKHYFPLIYKVIYRLLKGKNPDKSIRFSRQDDYYRHFDLKDIESLLGSRFKIEIVHRRGLLISVLSIWLNYLFNSFGLQNSGILSFINYCSDLEYRLSFGRFSYYLLVVATKL